MARDRAILALSAIIGWAIICAASTLVYGAQRGWPPGSLWPVVALHTAGSAIAIAGLLVLARIAVWLGLSLPPVLRSPAFLFVTAFILLFGGTLAVNAFLFSQIFRSYFAQWHGPFGSRLWLFQTLWTSASAAAQYMVLGSRFLLPLGLPGAFLFALHVATRRRGG